MRPRSPCFWCRACTASPRTFVDSRAGCCDAVTTHHRKAESTARCDDGQELGPANGVASLQRSMGLIGAGRGPGARAKSASHSTTKPSPPMLPPWSKPTRGLGFRSRSRDQLRRAPSLRTKRDRSLELPSQSSYASTCGWQRRLLAHGSAIRRQTRHRRLEHPPFDHCSRGRLLRPALFAPRAHHFRSCNGPGDWSATAT